MLRNFINRRRPRALAVPDDYLALQNSFFGDLTYLNQNYFRSFSTYLGIIQFAFYAGCMNVLELGAGLSTLLFASYAKMTGAKVYSVDLDFGPMYTYANTAKNRTLIQNHVQLSQGLSVRPEQIYTFYEQEHPTLVGIPGHQIEPFLKYFYQSCEERQYRAIKKQFGRNSRLPDLFVTKSGGLFFPRNILDLYCEHGDFDREITYLTGEMAPYPDSVLEQLHDDAGNWDLVFFDSGELSSIVEWIDVEKHIKEGGLAVFHDIYFPKSIKNAVVSACISAHPGWQVLYVEDRTPQGLLIAKKVGT